MYIHITEGQIERQTESDDRQTGDGAMDRQKLCHTYLFYKPDRLTDRSIGLDRQTDTDIR